MSLRHRLRADTRASHDIVDAAFERYDLGEFEGYVRFLGAHLRALQTLASGYCLENRTAMTIEVTPLIVNIRADLATLGRTEPKTQDTIRRDYEPTALKYVLRGSRMGMAVLRKVWERSDDPRVLRASQFLSTSNPPDHWRQFCDDLNAQSATGARADKIIADAQTIFDVYARAGRHSTEPLQGFQHAKISASTAG